MKRLLLAAVAACLLLPFGTASAAEVFKIGLIGSYTGVFATWGPQFQHAIEAYQAIHGKTVKGPKGEEIEVQIVPRDAASGGPDKAKQLAEELILREKVKMLAGFELSPHAMAVGDLATQAKIPVVIMNAATASITRGSPYYVSTSLTIPQWSYTFGKWAAAHGYKKIYIATSDYAPGHDAEEYFAKGFEQSGGKIIGKLRTPLSTVDFAPYIERIKNAKPDALYLFQPGGTPSINFIKTFLERGLKTDGIQLLAGGELAEIFLPNFPDDTVGALSVTHYTATNKRPENLQLRAQLKKMFGDKAVTDIASVAAWDGIKLIYMALHKLGANAPGLAYVDAMKGQRISSPRGEIMIDPVERDVVQNIYIRRVEMVNGKLENVDIDTIPMVKDPWKIDHPAK
jgi:branched-chain amino acid transport system substrate-binding protein